MDQSNLISFINEEVNHIYISNIKDDIQAKINSYSESQINYLRYQYWESNLIKNYNTILNNHKYALLKNFMFYSNLITHEISELQNMYKFDFDSPIPQANPLHINKIVENDINSFAFEGNINSYDVSTKKVNDQIYLKQYTMEQKQLALRNLDIKLSFINIIAFGKNLFYYLRYIIWLCRYKVMNNEDLIEILGDGELYERTKGLTNIFIYCDNESSNKYSKDFTRIREQFMTDQITDNVKILNRPSNGTDELNLNLIESKNFNDYLNLFDNQEEFTQLYQDEITFLREANINIYIVESSHYLAKGIGAKRALINYNSYLLCEEIYSEKYFAGISKDEIEVKKNNFCIMQLDDNITAILELDNVNCRHSNAIRYICPQKDGFETTDGSYKYLEENCNIWSVLSVYNALWSNCVVHDYLIAGIRKGKGDRTNKEDDNTTLSVNLSYAIYKLTVQKPYRLYNYGYFYNPFNCRFMEDIAFNGLSFSSEKSIKLGNLFLRFGHYYDSKDDNLDYNDCINRDIIETHEPTTPIYGVYLMLYYYIKMLYLIGLLQINTKEIPYSYDMRIGSNVTTMICPTPNNKYNWMHMLIYQMLNIDWFVKSDYFNQLNKANFRELLTIEMRIIDLVNEDDEDSNKSLMEYITNLNSFYEKVRPYLKMSVDIYYKKPLKSSYEKKYLKYKLKYLELKKKINNIGV